MSAVQIFRSVNYLDYHDQQIPVNNNSLLNYPRAISSRFPYNSEVDAS